MPEQSWEILPVGVTDMQRRKEIENSILRNIEDSLENGTGMTESNRSELETERYKTIQLLCALALSLTIN